MYNKGFDVETSHEQFITVKTLSEYLLDKGEIILNF